MISLSPLPHRSRKWFPQSAPQHAPQDNLSSGEWHRRGRRRWRKGKWKENTTLHCVSPRGTLLFEERIIRFWLVVCRALLWSWDHVSRRRSSIVTSYLVVTVISCYNSFTKLHYEIGFYLIFPIWLFHSTAYGKIVSGEVGFIYGEDFSTL
jgi:hypothetical protein